MKQKQIKFQLFLSLKIQIQIPTLYRYLIDQAVSILFC